MKVRRDQFFKILFLVTFWIVAAVFYVFLEMAIEDYSAEFRNIDSSAYNLTRVLIIAVIATLIGGTIIAFFEVVYFSKKFTRKPLGIVLLIKNLFYLANIFIFTSLATLVSSSFILESSLFSQPVLESYYQYLISPKIWAMTLYWGFTIMLSLFILNISEKLGSGVLLNYILGKYHRPKEESRIFMFIDLTSSSAYAEQLGHIKYSKLIQDCFYDLNDVIHDYDVQIYQYVGDEAVLTWQKEKGIEGNKCIKIYFAFDKAIQRRSEYYNLEYGVVPEFKAGANFGFVTIAEVGQSKKELAYHGDAINTAAHLRSVCGQNSRRLLISADLLSVLKDVDDEFNIEYMGVCELKGKKNVVGLFSVSEKE